MRPQASVARIVERGNIVKIAQGDYRSCISGLVVEYIVAIDVTRVRFPADAFLQNLV
jgi:hypothetical protein